MFFKYLRTGENCPVPSAPKPRQRRNHFFGTQNACSCRYEREIRDPEVMDAGLALNQRPRGRLHPPIHLRRQIRGLGSLPY